MKSLKWWQGHLKWMGDLATMQRKQSASDHKYLGHNGNLYKLFDEFLKLRGNGYNGGEGCVK